MFEKENKVLLIQPNSPAEARPDCIARSVGSLHPVLPMLYCNFLKKSIWFSYTGKMHSTNIQVPRRYKQD